MEKLDREDATKIKAALRAVFGMRKMDAWCRATAPVTLVPGDCVDVVFQELKRLIKTTTGDSDPVSQIASCLLLQRLPPAVRDQVLLRCGETLDPAEVVKCSRQLLSTTISADSIATHHSAMVAAKGSRPFKDDGDRKSFRCGGCGRVGHHQDRCRVKCFKCNEVGHIARVCTSRQISQSQKAQSAVPGNGEAGQPRE